MSESRHGNRMLVIIVAVAVVAILVYGIIPYAATTSIGKLTPGTTVYVYGNVTSRFAAGSISLFELTQGNQSVAVMWNGTIPSLGSHVLVHGTVHGATGFLLNFRYIDASSVTVWYF